ncbi:DUF1847 domain-containing protein [Rhodopseudomonas sp. HC1]|uniref:DUF1847 domain-containing protein n=1 Tax=Rhodopseudomonas infernalis TaxID=2897386 RepID=UPI001EE9153A|nr:DUF1847 domain-containing protein [Rhodopseudomonas infernalis]MCG6203428.1 DUF1847 domain-containing protein [Rhodopseudomonas infernalis]
MVKKSVAELSCADCGPLNCDRRDQKFPKFCLTEAVDTDLLNETLELYTGAGLDGRIAHAAAEVEGLYYGKLSRVEETVAFARRIGAQKIGVASCVGLMSEAKIFVKVLERAGFRPYTVACKLGSVDKTAIGIPEELKIKSGSFEGMCNPALQAKALNAVNTDLNVMIGLCVGHDSLFYRYSKAPVTTLVVKDRVLGHNPVAALYTAETYCSRLQDAERLQAL